MSASYNRQQQKKAMQQFREWASTPATQQSLQSLTIDDLGPQPTHRLTQVLAAAGQRHPAAGKSASDLISVGLNAFQSPSSPQLQTIQFIFQQLQEDRRIAAMTAIASTGVADHRERRNLVRRLGLMREPPRILHYVTVRDDRLVIADDAAPFRIIERSTVASKQAIKCRSRVTQNCNPPAGSIYVGKEIGYYVVKRSESVVFISRDCSSALGFKVELAVIRYYQESDFDQSIFDWLNTVINMSIGERRDVRPSHQGTVNQVGLNSGPRHARILGWAKSYTKNLSEDEKASHDKDVIGAATFMWSLANAYLPIEVIDPLQEAMEKSGCPRIATRAISEGTGYTIQIGDYVYPFRTAVRAPPTTYIFSRYSSVVHRDATFAPFSIAGTTHQDIPDLPHAVGSFVDTDLQVVVEQAQGTFIGFRPDHRHASTSLEGYLSQGISNNFDDLAKRCRTAQSNLAYTIDFEAASRLAEMGFRIEQINKGDSDDRVYDENEE